ncbi:hypothetical protein C8Q80DRAFT_1117303 [Daedaleopsis nitida]|nr:hypothetical protein C8Q80DRAFT_1117303 [Daedaleopsis nitida]
MKGTLGTIGSGRNERRERMQMRRRISGSKQKHPRRPRVLGGDNGTLDQSLLCERGVGVFRLRSRPLWGTGDGVPDRDRGDDAARSCLPSEGVVMVLEATSGTVSTTLFVSLETGPTAPKTVFSASAAAEVDISWPEQEGQKHHWVRGWWARTTRERGCTPSGERVLTVGNDVSAGAGGDSGCSSGTMVIIAHFTSSTASRRSE